MLFATLFDRFKAFVVDTFMILMPIMYIVIYVVLGNREEFKENMAFGWSLILGSHFIIIMLFWLFKSQTPGLKAYELKLTSRSGKKANILQLILRYLATLFNFVFLITFIFPLFNKNRFTFQDIASYTCIVVDDKK